MGHSSCPSAPAGDGQAAPHVLADVARHRPPAAGPHPLRPVVEHLHHVPADVVGEGEVDDQVVDPLGPQGVGDAAALDAEVRLPEPGLVALGGDDQRVPEGLDGEDGVAAGGVQGGVGHGGASSLPPGGGARGRSEGKTGGNDRGAACMVAGRRRGRHRGAVEGAFEGNFPRGPGGLACRGVKSSTVSHRQQRVTMLPVHPSRRPSHERRHLPPPRRPPRSRSGRGIPPPSRPDDRPGFWETLRAYVADQEPRTPAQIAAAKAARNEPDPPPDPSLPRPSFWGNAAGVRRRPGAAAGTLRGVRVERGVGVGRVS